MYLRKKGRSKKSVEFNPDREYLKMAVDNYLKKGGKITINETSDCYERFISLADHSGLADQFLLGRD